MHEPLSITVVDCPDEMAVGQTYTVKLQFHCAAEWPSGVIVPRIRTAQHAIQLNTDLLPHELQLQPGEACIVCIGVTMTVSGRQDLSQIVVQCNPVGSLTGKEHRMVPLPTWVIEVVPSLDNELNVSLRRICSYDDAAKIEVTVHHRGRRDLANLRLQIGPSAKIRSGITQRRLDHLRSGNECKLELIVAGDTLEIQIDSSGPERTLGLHRTLTIPSQADSTEEIVPFTFLEPKNFTTDQIELQPEKSSVNILPSSGVYLVRGGRTRYKLTIRPTRSSVQEIRVYALAGQVEVEPRPEQNGAWDFLLTVVDDPKFTKHARLDYDVKLSGETLRGEIHLSIRPNNASLWIVAATAGLALTVKGVVALGPVLFRPSTYLDFPFEDLPRAFQQRWFDWFQLGSILVVRAVFSVIDRCKRNFWDEV